MNSFSNMEINDLLDNRFRLDPKHTPNYLAECFQRLSPTLGRMGLSTVIDEMARANSRCFGAMDGDMPSGAGMRHCEANSSRLPVRGETLSLGFFFELWKRNFRFEGGIYDKFVFSDELRLAFRINPREFWDVLIRADREVGVYLRDCFELMDCRELPREMCFSLKAGRGSLDYKDANKIKELLPRSNGTLARLEDIAKACVSIWGMPKFFDERRIIEELCRENGVHLASMPRGSCIPFPLKNIPNLRVDFLKKAAVDRNREAVQEFEKKEKERQETKLPELSYQEPLFRAEPYNDRPTETSIYDVSRDSKGRALANPITSLEESFRNIVIDDFIAFKQNFPQHKDTIIISETSRSLEAHVNILLGKWKDGTLTTTYTGDIYKKMMEAKNSPVRIPYLLGDSDTSNYFDNPTAENAQKVFLTVGTTRHMSGKALDISGRFNSHTFKKDLVEFLNNTRRYKIFMYINSIAKYTAEGGEFFHYRNRKDNLPLEEMWTNLERDSNWFFHVQ